MPCLNQDNLHRQVIGRSVPKQDGDQRLICSSLPASKYDNIHRLAGVDCNAEKGRSMLSEDFTVKGQSSND